MIGGEQSIEWYVPKKGKDFGPGDQGFDVPSVFRDHRHQYSAKPEDREAYRRQITYRCGHIGTKELEIVLRDYLTLHSAKMTYAELEQFDEDILDMENPQLQRYLMNGEALEPEHDTKYMNILVEYVGLRKSDYSNNVPNYVI